MKAPFFLVFKLCGVRTYLNKNIFSFLENIQLLDVKTSGSCTETRGCQSCTKPFGISLSTNECK